MTDDDHANVANLLRQFDVHPWCGGDPVDYDESTVFVSHVGYLLRSQVVCQCGARAPFGTPTGDGLIAALQVLAEVVRTGRPVSEVCRMFEPVPQVLKNVRYASGKPLELKPVKEAIAAAETRLGDSGRLVIRPSGTEPLIRVMAEGDDAGLVSSIVDELCSVIAKAA